MRARLHTTLIVLVSVTASCRSHKVKYVPQDVQQVLGVDAPTIQAAIAGRVDRDSAPSWVTPERWKIVRAMYAVYDHAPIWIEPAGVKERAAALLAALDSAPSHALRTDAYPLDSIRRVVDTKKIDSGVTARDIANADVLLTAAYVGYASDMLIGQVDPSTLSQSWFIPARRSAVDSALVHTLEDSSIADGLEHMAPQDSEYTVLKREYAHYRSIAASGGWPALVTGMSREELTARLVAEGYMVADADSIAAVVARWQENHDLAPDGRIGRATLAALNVPVDERVRQIASNMERHRWLPRSLGQRYVYVNVPAFRLDAYDSGQRVLSMKVVVGAEYDGHTTPVFSDSMRWVVFRPYWRPTETILKTELLPKIAKDKTFLARNDMEFARESGAKVLRQRPGIHNSLGLVKFLFPNDYNIYLHDTNEKSFFAKNARAASHGCIRLEQPDKLAEYVLGWPTDSVKAAMETGSDNRTVVLAKKLPVYIVYFTSYERDGQLHFADDVYRRDDGLKTRIIVGDANPSLHLGNEHDVRLGSPGVHDPRRADDRLRR
jgi:murein L,D-transpeptidase YcbB/YkuD